MRVGGSMSMSAEVSAASAGVSLYKRAQEMEQLSRTPDAIGPKFISLSMNGNAKAKLVRSIKLIAIPTKHRLSIDHLRRFIRLPPAGWRAAAPT